MKKLIYLFLTVLIVGCGSEDDNCDVMTTIVFDCECSYIDKNTYTVFFTTVDEENCEILEDCYCECYNDTDGDGICDENE
tara:strand:- start:339 stop:578 length:240 start_codon:yes stop_codon:yes gene_type:complete